MKKAIILEASLLFISTLTNAQTWSGSTTSTGTTGKAAVGTTGYQNSQLTIRNIQGAGSTNSALKIINAKSGAGTVDLLEVWSGSLVVTGFPPSGTSYIDSTKLFYVSNNEEVGTKSNLKVGTSASIGTSLSVGTTASIGTSLRIGATAANGAYAGYRLSVDGDMIAKKCVIQVSNWADYVFADDYVLPELSDVKEFITKNKHLPDVPSEAKVLEEGIEMGEMNKILLKKIEELTLYTIKLSEEVAQLKKVNNH